MKAQADSTEIGIVVYPGAQLAAVHGLTELLVVASRFAQKSGGTGQSHLCVSHWGHGTDGEGPFSCVYSTDGRTAPQPQTLIVPPTMVDPPSRETSTRVARWLLGGHVRGVRLVSICSGIFPLADTGLLDGRVVATHRYCARLLAERHPRVTADLVERMIEYPDILTAGGFMAWVDVGLLLVERAFGTAIRDETARFILTDPVRVRAGLPPRFLPPQAHGDSAIVRAQHVIHQRDGQGLSLSSIAGAAGLERRTFIRRFANATGLKPTAYCQTVRLARACEMLEGGNIALKEIAASLGYGDVAAFSRAFRRVYGQAPGAYRKAHGGGVAGAVADSLSP